MFGNIYGVNEVEYGKQNVVDWQLAGSDAGDREVRLRLCRPNIVTDLLIATRCDCNTHLLRCVTYILQKIEYVAYFLGYAQALTKCER